MQEYNEEKNFTDRDSNNEDSYSFTKRNINIDEIKFKKYKLRMLWNREKYLNSIVGIHYVSDPKFNLNFDEKYDKLDNIDERNKISVISKYDLRQNDEIVKENIDSDKTSLSILNKIIKSAAIIIAILNIKVEKIRDKIHNKLVIRFRKNKIKIYNKIRFHIWLIRYEKKNNS